jgi:hypothetical protein
MNGGKRNIKMSKKLIICGDSFNIGIGCIDLHTEPYGVLLANNLERELFNLAKGSSTNLSIYLQAEYAVKNIASEDDIVLVSHTSYDRVDWFPMDYKFGHEITNVDVNYHQYPPYRAETYHQVLDKHPMQDDPLYKGGMFTENYMGVIDFWETFRKDDKYSGYYARFQNEPKERMKTLYDFATTIHDPRINRLQSIGVMTMAHQLLKKHNIKHLMLTQEPEEYAKYMDEENLVRLSWGELSVKYPDEIKTWHTGPDGHNEAYNIVLTKLKENGWA